MEYIATKSAQYPHGTILSSGTLKTLVSARLSQMHEIHGGDRLTVSSFSYLGSFRSAFLFMPNVLACAALRDAGQKGNFLSEGNRFRVAH